VTTRDSILYLDAHMRMSYKRAQVTSRYIGRLGQEVGFETDEYIELAVDAVLSAQISQAESSWEYLSTFTSLEDPNGTVLPAEAPIEVLVGAATHDGVPLETIYRRPGLKAAGYAADGLDAVEILDRMVFEAEACAGSDVAVAGRHTEQAYGAVDERIVGWRRVPNAGACKYCQYIATQRYKTKDLAPAHEYCACGTKPILSEKVVDPGHVLDEKKLLEIKRDGVPTRYGQRAADSKRANRRIDNFGEKYAEPVPRKIAPKPVLPKKVPKPTVVKPFEIPAKIPEGALPIVPKGTPNPKRIGEAAPAYKKLKTDEVVELFAERNPDIKLLPGKWAPKPARVMAETIDDLSARYPLAEGHRIAEVGNIREVFKGKRIGRGTQGLANPPSVVFDEDLGEWIVRETKYEKAKIGVTTGSLSDGGRGAREQFDMGWWSTGDVATSVTHEYGHQVGYSAELTLLKRHMPTPPPSRGTALSTGVRGNRLMADLWQHEMIDVVATEAGIDSAGLTWRDIVPTIEGSLSKYATKNGREVMAESFAEVALKGESARPLAQAVVARALSLIEEGRTVAEVATRIAS